MITAKKNIAIDENKLRRIAEEIGSYSENFNADLKRLVDCLSELPNFWSGDAEQAYAKSLLYDLEVLEETGDVFSELSKNYRYALIEYEKTAHRTMDIVGALKI